MIKELYEQLKSGVLEYFLETEDIEISQKYDMEYYVSIKFEVEGFEFHWLLDNSHIICMDSGLKFTDKEVSLIAKKITKMIENNPKELEKFKLIKSLISFSK